MALALPPDLVALFSSSRPAILARLDDFASVPPADYFYELCYCLLTPQSKAAHAGIVVESLKEVDFQRTGCDVLHLLRNKDTYIRFHNTKHQHLHEVRVRWSEIFKLISATSQSDKDARENAIRLRDELASSVKGLGMKEASHFLRNIGFRGLAIIDRHLITSMVRCGLFAEAPPVATPAKYREVEHRFRQFSDEVKIDLDELDLLFWSAQTGVILK